MKFSSKRTRFAYSSALAILCLGFAAFSFTADKFQQVIAKTNLFNLRFPQEKIYLHLDRPSYWANENIWFKAYIKDSPINYWNPVVRTDSTGVAITVFYNSDEPGNIKIVVEGVTADGKLCRGIGNYSVKY